MADYKVGSTSWEEDDVVVQGGKFEKTKPMPILRMENGKSYRLRIISKPYRYYAKWVKTGKGKKLKLNSSLTADCPLCQDGVAPKPGRYIRVIFRDASGPQFKILDCGSQIYSGIKKIQDIPDYGKDVTKYDITITKGAEGSQPLYSVVPMPPAPMNAADIAVATANAEKLADGKLNPDYINLEERCKPLPVDVIKKILASGTEVEKTPAADATATAEAEIFGAQPGAEAPEVAATPVSAPNVAVASAPVAAAPTAAKATKGSKSTPEFLDF